MDLNHTCVCRVLVCFFFGGRGTEADKCGVVQGSVYILKHHLR